jgi:hypothetical protein
MKLFLMSGVPFWHLMQNPPYHPEEFPSFQPFAKATMDA